MTQATIKSVNAAIARHQIEIVKGHGYFYFMPSADAPVDLVLPDVESVYTPFIRDLTKEQWIEHVEQFFPKPVEYRIQFEDQGQDILHLTVDGTTGEIKDCGIFHSELYASGDCFVRVDMLETKRFVQYNRTGVVENMTFRWPMVRLMADDRVLCDVNNNFAP